MSTIIPFDFGHKSKENLKIHGCRCSQTKACIAFNTSLLGVFSTFAQGEVQFNIPGMKRCFLKLIAFMNHFRAAPMSFPIAT